ncbi:hypothetical protein D3C79_1112910 [compost metagenome]
MREVCDSIEYIKTEYKYFGEIDYESDFSIIIKRTELGCTEYIYGERMDVNSLGDV